MVCLCSFCACWTVMVGLCAIWFCDIAVAEIGRRAGTERNTIMCAIVRFFNCLDVPVNESWVL